MILMIEICVRMNRRSVPSEKRKSLFKGHGISHFWRWDDLMSYMTTLLLFTAFAASITVIFTPYPIFLEGLGMLTLSIEACLGLPLLAKNFRLKSTKGLSGIMVSLWVIGDIIKTIYFIVLDCPPQFYVCSSVAFTVDIVILSQICYYGKHSVKHSPMDI